MPRRSRRLHSHAKTETGKLIGAGLLALVTMIAAGFGIYLWVTTPNPEKVDRTTLCPSSPPRDIIVIALDTTDGLPSPSRTEAMKRLTDRIEASPKGALLEVRVVDPAHSAGKPVLTLCNPGDGQDLSEFKGNPSLARKVWTERFRGPLVRALEGGLNPASAKTSPLLATFQGIALDRFTGASVASASKRLVIVSDMIEYVPGEYSQYPPADLRYERFKTTSTYRKVRTDLHGAYVDILYIDRNPSLKQRLDTGAHITFWMAWIDDLPGTLAVAEAVKRLLPSKQDRSRVTSLIERGLAAEKKGEHDWPPIIRLSDAKGYSFEKGRAELTPEFESELSASIVPRLLDLTKRYGVTVIEVIGHTDEQRIAPRPSNLDALLLGVLQSSESLSNLTPGDNAGLGLARATAVVRILRLDERLKGYTLLPLSGGQLVGVDDRLTTGGGGDAPQRRRIEIRIRRSTYGDTTASIQEPKPTQALVNSARVLTGRVNWIVDGDTFDMQTEGQTVRIRICGIDAPERGDPGYERAKDFLHRGIMNRDVRCVPAGEGSVCDGRSRRMNQGRLVAQCFLEKDFDIAVPMVESGNACDWPHFSGGHYQKVTKKPVCVQRRVY